MTTRPFIRELIRQAMGSGTSIRRWNALRFGQRTRSLAGVKNRCKYRLANAVRTIRDIEYYKSGCDLYADDSSRELYVRLLANRIVGDRAALPLNSEEFWRSYDKASALVPVGETRPGGAGLDVPIFDMEPYGFNLKLRIRANGILAYCFLGQYECRRLGDALKANPGDVVIDGGSAWGDTALMFSEKVGSSGRVVAVECMDDVLALFHENMAMNVEAASRIELIKAAIWSSSDDQVSFVRNGPGSRVVANAGTSTSDQPTITIDEIVRRLSLAKVNLIKLDVEGSELAAFKGAADTLKRFRPKLVVSAYHKPRDIVDLAKYLKDLDLGYEMYLDHYTNHGEETVLYALAAN